MEKSSCIVLERTYEFIKVDQSIKDNEGSKPLLLLVDRKFDL